MPGTAIGVATDGTPTNGDNPWIDSLTWGGRWIDDPTAPTPDGATTITYAAASGSLPIQPNIIGAVWTAPALTALQSGFDAWSSVANVIFTKTTTAGQADIGVWQLSDANISQSLGLADVPGVSSGNILGMYFNREVAFWSATGLAKGGLGFTTIIHEIGHALGLAHPHDGGNSADKTIFPGVTSDFGSYGDNHLNQGIFTTMSYNAGWDADLPLISGTYGSQAGPMALDIAAVQAIYGANTNFNNAATTYTLPKVNAAGTYWSCIWDTGGVDTLSNAGSTTGATIDLRAAPLVGPNAGGYISYNSGIRGGYTIANGVVIENAIGGSGADTLNGNSSANTLEGGAGSDILFGDAGADTLLGGAGNDRIVYDAADLAANVNGGTDSDTLVVVGGSLPTGFDLVASAFEQAEWQQTDNAGQSWSTIVGRYNSNWQITSSSTKFDNGIEREMLFDYTAPVSWQSRQLDYAAPSAGSALIYDYFVFDDMSSRDTSYDTDLATSYKSIRNDYNAGGQRTYLYFVFENNSGRDTTYDYTTDIVWRSQQNDYDASGFKTYNYFDFDNGTSRDTSYDNTVGVVWQSLRQDYNVNGVMDYQYYVFDDNTARQVVIDATNQFSWNTQVTNYNAAGQAVEFFET
jgi:serralysin